MEYIEKAIREAVENGWNDVLYRVSYGSPDTWTHSSALFLDPLFWQSLGKARGWNKPQEIEERRATHSRFTKKNWLFHWHRFIDHLAEGKTAESFFKDLLH
jgi:hypothetical protein